jgi:hypothetical protein
MHLIAVLTFSLLQTHSAPQTVQAWEKRLAPGLEYRMEWDPTTPRVLNALRISLQSKAIHVYPQLAGKTVFEATPDKGREPVSQIVKEDDAIAGINGDFFPFTGDPLGLMVREGELLSAPYATKVDPEARRAAIGWGDASSALGLSHMDLTVQAQGEPAMPAEGFDEDGGPDRITVDTASVGLATAKAPNSYLVLTVPTTPMTPNSDIDGVVESIGTDLTSRPVQAGSMIILATGKEAGKLARIQTGQHVRVFSKVSGFDFDAIKNVIGGGPVLIKDGQIFVDYAEERFKKEFAEGRHPRSVIGRTRSGDIWLVAIDGRSTMSAGASLLETATIMQRLGCVDAMNLDGGGSTTFNLFGLTINRPSDGIERAVANGVLVKGPRPKATDEPLFLSHLPTIRPGAANRVKVVRGNPESKQALPNAEIIWTCTGAAWIDQGGTLHVRGGGTAHVTAFVRGRTVTADYTVAGSMPADEPKPGGKDD